MVQSLGKTTWHHLVKLNIHLTSTQKFKREILTCVPGDINKNVHSSAVCAAKTWKQSKRSTQMSEEWVHEL